MALFHAESKCFTHVVVWEKPSPGEIFLLHTDMKTADFPVAKCVSPLHGSEPQVTLHLHFKVWLLPKLKTEKTALKDSIENNTPSV